MSTTAYQAVKAAQQAMGTTPHEARPTGQCFAPGCPCAASCSSGGGRELCSWHARVHGDAWGTVTSELKAHQWLIDFIVELSVAHARGRLGAWQALAASFFRTEPRCQPAASEIASYPRYDWRMREELAYRVGVRKEPPEPRPPQSEEFRKPRQAQLERA